MGGSQMGYLTARGKLLFPSESGTVVPRLTNAASAPWCPSNEAPARPTQSRSQDCRVQRVPTTTDVGKVTQTKGSGSGGGGGGGWTQFRGGSGGSMQGPVPTEFGIIITQDGTGVITS